MNNHSDKPSNHALDALLLAPACLPAVRSTPNLTAAALVAESLRRREGRLSIDGSLMVETGVHTGRSVRDKFVVDEPSVSRDIWWGNINQRYSIEKFALLRARVQAYLQGQGPVHPRPVRRRRSGPPRARADRHHPRLVGPVRPQYVHPPSPAHELERFEPGLHHPAPPRCSRPIRRSTAPDPPQRSRCRSSKSSSSSPARNTPARSRNRFSPS